MTFTAEELEDMRAEFPEPPPRPQYACADRMCGALDCATCFPSSWWLDDSNPQSEG